MECAFDLGDCKISPDCECDENLLFNDECDPHCNIPECWNDLDACKYPDCQCPNDKFNNETCDWEEDCNNEKCHYDDGNCEYPNCHCNPYHIGDGTCNDDCNNPFCNFDNGDCSGSVSCKSCKFNPVGPLGAAADTDSLFDDLIKLDACCDIKLDSLTVLLGAGDVVHGIITEYTYNYKTQTEIRNVVGTEGTPNRIDFEDGETIIRITVTISEGKFVFIEIETTLNVY